MGGEMTYLSPAEISEVDRQIDDGIPIDELKAIPRNVMVLALLQQFEDFNRITIPQLVGNGPGHHEKTKLIQDAMHFAMTWVYQYCAADVPISSFPKSLTKHYIFAFHLIRIAENYSVAWDLLSLLRRGALRAARSADSTIILTRASEDTGAFEVSDSIINGCDDPYDVPDNPFCGIKLADLLSEAKVRKASKHHIQYDFPSTSFFRLQRSLDVHESRLFQLEPSWEAGSYTFSDLRSFFVALKAYCCIHSMICLQSHEVRVAGGGLADLILCKRPSAWANQMTRLCGLPFAKTKAIIDDLTFDPSLYLTGKKAHVCYQPFHALTENVLALSNELVWVSNVERNHWNLLEKLRPTLQSSLKNEKENTFIGGLKTELEKLGCRVSDRIRFYGANDQLLGDIDLLVLDERLKFGLVCEVKWFNAPDRISEVASCISQLKEAIAQVRTARTWASDHRTALAQRLNLVEDYFDGWQIEGAVISKNFTGNGQARDIAIPIISERLLFWILRDPHQFHIRILWQTCVDRGYLPVLAGHYDEEDMTVDFNGVTLKAINYGYKVLTPFDPSQDILLSDTTGGSES